MNRRLAWRRRIGARGDGAAELTRSGSRPLRGSWGKAWGRGGNDNALRLVRAVGRCKRKTIECERCGWRDYEMRSLPEGSY